MKEEGTHRKTYVLTHFICVGVFFLNFFLEFFSWNNKYSLSLSLTSLDHFISIWKGCTHLLCWKTLPNTCTRMHIQTYHTHNHSASSWSKFFQPGLCLVPLRPLMTIHNYLCITFMWLWCLQVSLWLKVETTCYKLLFLFDFIEDYN